MRRIFVCQSGIALPIGSTTRVGTALHRNHDEVNAIHRNGLTHSTLWSGFFIRIVDACLSVLLIDGGL